MAWRTLRTLVTLDLTSKNNINNAPEQAVKCCRLKPSQAWYIRRISAVANSMLNKLNSTEIRGRISAALIELNVRPGLHLQGAVSCSDNHSMKLT